MQAWRSTGVGCRVWLGIVSSDSNLPQKNEIHHTKTDDRTQNAPECVGLCLKGLHDADAQTDAEQNCKSKNSARGNDTGKSCSRYTAAAKSPRRNLRRLRNQAQAKCCERTDGTRFGLGLILSACSTGEHCRRKRCLTISAAMPGRWRPPRKQTRNRHWLPRFARRLALHTIIYAAVPV